MLLWALRTCVRITLPAAEPFFMPLVSIFTDMVLALRVLFSSTDLGSDVGSTGHQLKGGHKFKLPQSITFEAVNTNRLRQPLTSSLPRRSTWMAGSS